MPLTRRRSACNARGFVDSDDSGNTTPHRRSDAVAAKSIADRSVTGYRDLRDQPSWANEHLRTPASARSLELAEELIHTSQGFFRTVVVDSTVRNGSRATNASQDETCHTNCSQLVLFP